jgi:hypothetical protein
VTRDADETLPEELRQAIESERLWDDLPPELEERLARRIGDSLASKGAAESVEPVTPRDADEPRSTAITRRGLPTVLRRASDSLKWWVIFAGGLVAAGAMGAGLVTVIQASFPSEDPPSRETQAPVRKKGGPKKVRPQPLPASEEVIEEVIEPPLDVPVVVPEVPLLPAPPPSSTKPAAPSRSKVKREPPPPPVEAKPAEAPPLPSRSTSGLVSERDWSLLKQAREANAQGRYGEALTAVTQHEQEHPSSQLEQEREALRIQALVGMGRREEARALARSFEQRFPESILLESIRETVGEE